MNLADLERGVKLCEGPSHKQPTELPLARFMRDKTRPDGYAVQCDICKLKGRPDNPDSLRRQRLRRKDKEKKVKRDLIVGNASKASAQLQIDRMAEYMEHLIDAFGGPRAFALSHYDAIQALPERTLAKVRAHETIAKIMLSLRRDAEAESEDALSDEAIDTRIEQYLAALVQPRQLTGPEDDDAIDVEFESDDATDAEK